MDTEIGIDLSDRNVIPFILQRQEEIRGLIVKSLPDSPEQWMAARDLPITLTHEVIIPAMLWLNNEARKKGVRKYRDLLKKAIDYREAFSLPYIAGDGTRKTEYPLETLFQSFDSHHLGTMIAKCDEILGTKEPTRYPRQKVILETLSLWTLYSGKNPPKNAIQPNKYTGDREATPYTLCKLVLMSIEDCSDVGDFSGMYETVVKKHFPSR